MFRLKSALKFKTQLFVLERQLNLRFQNYHCQSIQIRLIFQELEAPVTFQVFILFF